MTQGYDSTNPYNIPEDAAAVFGYIDGLYAWSTAQWNRFPNAVKKTIAVFASNNADILDVEKGDATALEVPAWVVRQRNRGVEPTIYCSRIGSPGEGWPDVRDALAAAGVPEPHYWIADYTDPPVSHMVPGSAATQWTDFRDIYDITEADPAWLGLSPTPPSPPPPPPPSEDPMLGISPSVITSTDGYQHRASIVYPGGVVHSWLDQSGKWQSEDLITQVIKTAKLPPGNPFEGLRFDPNQVPTVQLIGKSLVIAVQMAVAGVSYEFDQTVGTAGWGIKQIVGA